MKIAIIGGGITGLYLSWKLSKTGFKVTVFEKKKEIGKEACSGLFSKRILEFIPESKRIVQNEIKFVLIHFPKKTITINFSKSFLVINHSLLDKLVADLAKKEGVEIILNHPVDSIPQFFDKVIGCDGPRSVIRKKLNLPELNYRLGILGFISEENSSDFVETWPVKNGFIWKIPRGQKTEYGIISDPKKAKTLFQDFLKKHNLKIEDQKTGLIPFGFSIPSNSSVTLCGDASGLTKPWSGGGVIWGLNAADILLKNFPDFLKYRKEVKKIFFLKIVFSKIAVKLVYFLGFNAPWLLPEKREIESDFLIHSFKG